MLTKPNQTNKELFRQLCLRSLEVCFLFLKKEYGIGMSQIYLKKKSGLKIQKKKIRRMKKRVSYILLENIVHFTIIKKEIVDSSSKYIRINIEK